MKNGPLLAHGGRLLLLYFPKKKNTKMWVVVRKLQASLTKDHAHSRESFGGVVPLASRSGRSRNERGKRGESRNGKSKKCLVVLNEER